MRKYEDEEKGGHGMRLALMVLIKQLLFSISQAISLFSRFGFTVAMHSELAGPVAEMWQT